MHIEKTTNVIKVLTPVVRNQNIIQQCRINFGSSEATLDGNTEIFSCHFRNEEDPAVPDSSHSKRSRVRSRDMTQVAIFSNKSLNHSLDENHDVVES